MKITLPQSVLLAGLLLAAGSVPAQSFPVFARQSTAAILYDPAGPALDSVAANLLADDIERVTKVRPKVLTNAADAAGSVIVIGEAGSGLLERFAGKQSRFLQTLKGRRECFGYKVVNKPAPRVDAALLVGGSDARGTAYGALSLSERLGVSPWYWWADVPVQRRNEIVLQQPEFVSETPSVAYRGIFINDEDWGLRPWAAGTFEPEKQNIGPKTYAKVFELLLRLKANLLWPAMHPGTEPFFADSANAKLAAAYGIVIGSSHAEPMLRNNVGEWNEKTMGDFNYRTNKERIYTYWQDRVKQSLGTDAIYSVGMRGVHDSGIEGVKTTAEAVPLLERIIADQRQMLQANLHKDATAVPQAFTAYKEVLDIYDSGLKLPGDVTLVWPDDNYGYIQRLNNEEEKSRTGGSGVYYHASYWGRPHDYLWLSTTHPALIREEMMKAYDNGSNRLWVLNVGDIKPLEYNMQLFFDMAYNAKPFASSRSVRTHLQNWTAQVFGAANAPAITEVLWSYYNLAFERRPEFMGWSQTEPTTNTTNTAYNHFWHGDEAFRRVQRYEALEQSVRQLRGRSIGADAAAFYELVYYPVVCASWMNKKFLYRDKALLFGQQGRFSARTYAALSAAAYDSIAKETAVYNERLLNGKWKGMMSMVPRDLPVFREPVLPPFSPKKGERFGVAVEGGDSASSPALPPFRAGLKQRYFIDIFLADSVALSWKAVPSAEWIRLSVHQGTLASQEGKADVRLWVSIDERRLPAGKGSGGVQLVIAGKTINVPVEVLPVPADFAAYHGAVEAAGEVSIFAAHFTTKKNGTENEWEVADGLGHSGTALVAKAHGISDTTLLRKQAGSVSYSFYSFSSGVPQLSVYTLPTHPLNKSFGMHYALRIDDGPLQALDFRTVGRSEEWKQNVLRNAAVRTVPLPPLKPGRHTVTVYAVDPGVVLDRLLIQFGTQRKTYGLVPETRKD